MSRKKDPASAVVEFFGSASLETAETVLAICKGIVARRAGRPTSTSPRLKRPARTPTAVPPGDVAKVS